MQSFIVGQRVVATTQIVEGIAPGNPKAVFPASDYIHAETHDEGVVEHVDGDELARASETCRQQRHQPDAAEVSEASFRESA